MQYKTVIFDVDGTLFDTSQGIFNCINYVLEKFNYRKISKNELFKFIGPPIYTSFKNICKMDENTANIATEMYRKFYIEKFISQSKLYDGMLDLLEQLYKSKATVAIATMKTQQQIDKLLDIFNIKDYFSCVIGADTITKKTKAQMISEVLEKTNSALSESVMIGDTSFDGIGAYQAGIDFIAVTYGFGINSEKDLLKNKVIYKYTADNVGDLNFRLFT